MTTRSENKPVDFIIQGLRNAATELEALQVQLALGKSELKDVFENLKKDLQTRLHELTAKIRAATHNPGLLPFINALEELHVQLALGLAEGRESFENQKKQIEKSLAALESKLKLIRNEEMSPILVEIEKFRAKLDLLALSYQLKKITLEYDLKQRKADLEAKLHSIKTQLGYKEEEVKEKWEEFKGEIKNTFAHLRSVFQAHD